MQLNISKYIQQFILIITCLIFSSNKYFSQTLDLSTAELTKIADGFQFVEGPIWKDGALLFSDIPANKIYKWTHDSGVTVFLEHSGNSNGLSFNKNGNLILAQHGERRIASLETDGSQTVLASHFEGKKFNSPNDIAVKSDGSIFFTDPPYGISKEQEELGYYGIYRISPAGYVQLLDKTLRRPNGIVFSPDEKKLYVNDCEAKIIYVWDVISDTAIANKKQFAVINIDGYGVDGMKVDSKGNLYSTGPKGLWVFAPDGTLLKMIEVPGQTTNCNWGGEDKNTLFITSGNTVYDLRNTIKD